MSIFDAIIQGIVQGLTEFLPVSSSGHLAITQHILGAGEEADLFFDVMLHVGTLVAVIAFYYKLIWSLIKEFCSMVKDIFTRKFTLKNMNYERNLIMMLIIGLVPLFLLFVPIPGTEMNIKDLAEMFSGFPVLIVTAVSLLLTSALLTIGIIFNRKNVKLKKEKENYTPKDAILVGLMQFTAALLPGLSRSGSTLSVGQIRGINKQKALDFSFILGVPAIVAAALLEGVEAISSPEGITVGIPVILAGMISSAVVGYLAIVIFKWFLKSDKMEIFVIYTAVVGVLLVVISIIEMNTGVNIFTGAPINW